MSAANAARSLTPTGDWLSRSFRLAMSSLGGYLPVILLAVIPWFLALAVCVWYGLRDGVMVADFETGNIAFEGLDDRLPMLFAGAAILTMLFFGLRLLYTTTSRNVAAAHRVDGVVAHSDAAEEIVTSEEPEMERPLAAAARQWPSVSGVTLTRTLAYVVLYATGSLLALLSPFLILLFPLMAVAIVWVWVRFVLSNAPAALRGGWRQPLDEARRATTGHGMAVFGRLLALTVVGVSVLIMANLAGSIASAVSGSQPESTVEPFAETVPFNEILPSNPAALALSWVFLAIGFGLWQILSATAHTLLFLDLRGELGPEPEREDRQPD